MKTSVTRKDKTANKCETMDIMDGMTLAEAIVLQACEDYRAAIRGECEHPKRMIFEIMRFFESEWYETLTDVDYHYLVETMDKEYETGKRLIAEGLGVDCPELKKQYVFKCPICGGNAETHELRHVGRKRKDNTLKITHKRVFNCSCHITERVIVKEEVIDAKTGKRVL